MYNIWTWLMRLILVFNFNLLGHIAQPPCQGRTTVRGRQTHGLYTALFNGPWRSLNAKIRAKSSRKMQNVNLSQLYRIFIATLSLFFLRKITVFRSNRDIFAFKCEKYRAIARRFVPNASHDTCCLMTLSKSKPSGHTMCLLVVRYAITSPIFASSQRSVQSKLSKNWLVGTGQPTWPAQGTAVQAHGRQGTRWDGFHVIYGGNSKCQKNGIPFRRYTWAVDTVIGMRGTHIRGTLA